MLALYLHHDDDTFSKIFCPLLVDEALIDILGTYCLVLPWDITNSKDHNAIKKMINEYNELEFISFRLNKKKSGLLLVAPIDQTITLFGILQGNLKKNDIIEKIKLYCSNFNMELDCEKTLYGQTNTNTLKLEYKHSIFKSYDLN